MIILINFFKVCYIFLALLNNHIVLKLLPLSIQNLQMRFNEMDGKKLKVLFLFWFLLLKSLSSEYSLTFIDFKIHTSDMGHSFSMRAFDRCQVSLLSLQFSITIWSYKAIATYTKCCVFQDKLELKILMLYLNMHHLIW